MMSNEDEGNVWRESGSVVTTQIKLREVMKGGNE